MWTQLTKAQKFDYGRELRGIGSRENTLSDLYKSHGIHVVEADILAHVRGIKMFLKAQLQWDVVIPAEELGPALQKAIIIGLLNEFATMKATRDLGYLIAVSTLDKIGEGIVQSAVVHFPVTFTCITYKVFTGEILHGEVHQILRHGLFIRCGPYDNIYISHMKMQGYRFVSHENPYFINEHTAKIEKGVKLRVMVMCARYLELQREFQVVASLDGDFLGPL